MAGLSWVINFANSIVGVGVLAMPYCFFQAGILLATVMVLVSAAFTKLTCEFLLRASSYTRRSTFEQLSFHVYGNLGKLITELSIIGLLLGTLVAFQVVIGDLAPSVVHNILAVPESWSLRMIIMVASCGLILPLSLMRNVASLASFNALSMGFYTLFIFVIVCFSLPSLIAMEWWTKVNFWQSSAFFKSLPIISISFTCQTQVLVMYSALPDPSMKTMTEIINKAINLVTGIYITVGTFGYIAFFNNGIHGDILGNFPHGFLTDAIKLGFWFSVILSFPLIVFPVRAAINSFLYANHKQGVLHDVISSASDYIAPEKFTSITLGLVGGTLVIGILIPHIETVLSITGALVGTFLAFVYPSALFLKSGAKDIKRIIAQTILVVGIFAMVLSTGSVLNSLNEPHQHQTHDAHRVDKPDNNLITALPNIDKVAQNSFRMEKPVEQEPNLKSIDDVEVKRDPEQSNRVPLKPQQGGEDAKIREAKLSDEKNKLNDIDVVKNVDNPERLPHIDPINEKKSEDKTGIERPNDKGIGRVIEVIPKDLIRNNSKTVHKDAEKELIVHQPVVDNTVRINKSALTAPNTIPASEQKVKMGNRDILSS